VGANKKALATGLMLIVLGVGLYGMQFLGEAARPLLLALIGVAFVAGYFVTRVYMLLVTGCVMGGLGLGMFGEPRWFVLHEFTQIGLAIGFLLIYLIRLAYERRSHWWPLIPSLVLFLLGFQTWRKFRLFLFSPQGWPILIVIVGALIVLGALGKGRKKQAG